MIETDKLEKTIELSLLYDFYGELLTNHQKNVYEDYVLNDLSLSEIAENKGISRQGVHDTIKRCNKLLNDYEEKLHLVKKFQFVKEKVSEIETLTKHIDNTNNKITINGSIEQIKELTNEILEVF